MAKKIGKKLLREVFSKFFGHAGAPMHKTKNRGHRDLSVVKFSAWCDAWSSKKRKKTKIAETVKIYVKFDFKKSRISLGFGRFGLNTDSQ